MKSTISYFLMTVTILSTTFMGYSEPNDDDPKLIWTKETLSVLVVKKINDEGIVDHFVNVILWLNKRKNLNVYVEKAVSNERMFKDNSKLKLSKVKNNLSYFDVNDASIKDKIDFIICLGGDGTLLYTNTLFPETVPPIMPFHLGSLGFLAPFLIENFKNDIAKVLQGNATILHRDRIACKLIRKEGDLAKPPFNITVLNDVHLNRISSSITNLNVFYNGQFVTNVQADGIIISTATGSTAYAASSGASLLYPSVKAIIISAICPHTLSFRPIIVPLDGEIKITMRPSSRGNVSVVFDNKNQQELKVGDSLYITKSTYPVPTINSDNNQLTDWFSSLTKTLSWNVHPEQNDSEGPNSLEIDSSQ